MLAPRPVSTGGEASFRAIRSLVAQHRGLFVVATLLRAVASMLPTLHPYFLAQLATSGGDDVGLHVDHEQRGVRAVGQRR
ncbi:MAG: hypothetical protein AAFP84_12195, partial [Actinomycetota bacterium]